MKLTDKRLEKLIIKCIDEELKKRLTGDASFNDEKSFIGYNPLEKIRGSLFCWVAVPFNGINIYCQLRCPNAVQIGQCGNITNIIEEKLQKEKLNDDDLITIKNFQEELCKITFNIPTFDKICSLVGDGDFIISEKKKELKEIQKRFNENKDKITEVEKIDIDRQITNIEMQLGYILPDDTMSFITKWAMGCDVSDIKRINKDTFLRAAALAQANHKAPSDYISGRFTDFNKFEIDSYALSVYQDFLRDQQVVGETKRNLSWSGRNRAKNNEFLPKQEK